MHKHNMKYVKEKIIDKTFQIFRVLFQPMTVIVHAQFIDIVDGHAYGFCKSASSEAEIEVTNSSAAYK